MFGVESSFGGTLLEAVERGGKGEKSLGKHAVAALLNAASPDVNYAFTTGEVIRMVQDAYEEDDFDPARKVLEKENKRGCPIEDDD